VNNPPTIVQLGGWDALMGQTTGIVAKTAQAGSAGERSPITDMMSSARHLGKEARDERSGE
jgi:hypothetical protein